MYSDKKKDIICNIEKEREKGKGGDRNRKKEESSRVLTSEREESTIFNIFNTNRITNLSRFCWFLKHQNSPLAARWIIGRLVSLSDLSSMAKMSVVGGRERLALLYLAGVKGGSGLEFQLNTSYMDEDILISANKSFNATPNIKHTANKKKKKKLFFSFFWL